MPAHDLDTLDTEDRQPGLESRMDPAPEYMPRYHPGLGRLTGKAATVTGQDSGIERALLLKGDVRQENFCEEAVARTLDMFGDSMCC